MIRSMIIALDAVLVAACLAALILFGLAAWKPTRAGLQWCTRRSTSGMRLLLGFVAAFGATLIIRQFGLELLHLIGIIPGVPYNFNGVPPFGVPQVISLAFWGGVWGIVFVLVEPWLVRSPGGYWVGAIIFGAIFPTVFSWLVVAPLKGLPLGYGFHFPGILVGPIVNGLWGLGTAGLIASWKRVRAGLQWCHQSFHPHVDLLRGLFRLWIVTELLWSAYWIWYFARCYALPGGWAVYGPTCPTAAYFASHEFYLVISAFLVFPVIVFCCLYASILLGIMFVRLVSLIAVWVVRGFQRENRPRTYRDEGLDVSENLKDGTEDA